MKRLLLVLTLLVTASAYAEEVTEIPCTTVDLHEVDHNRIWIDDGLYIRELVYLYYVKENKYYCIAPDYAGVVECTRPDVGEIVCWSTNNQECP